MDGAETAPEDEGDDTKRVRRLMHGEMETLNGKLDHSERLVKRIQFWASLAVLVFMGGVGTMLFLARYATAEDLAKLADRHTTTDGILQQHIVNETARMSTLEAQGNRVEEDYHWQRDQLQRVADAVRAPRVPIPPHATIKPALPDKERP